MASASVQKPGEASAGKPTFTVGGYIRHLTLVCVDVQRLRSNTSTQGLTVLRESVKSLAALVTEGMTHAKSITPKADRDGFIEQIRKIVASSGTPMPAGPADLEPAKAPAVRTKSSLNEGVFRDRLPRFMKKWADGDPEWRLLECAIRLMEDQTFIIGMAETKQQQYSIFHGTNGGDYKTKKMELSEAQSMLTAAYKRGYSPISAKALSSRVGDENLLKQNYSVVRMTSGVDGQW